MNKSKIILCAVGGVFVIAVGVLGYLAYDAFSSKSAALTEGDDEGNAGLESVVGQIVSLSGKTPYPSDLNARRLTDNRQEVADWIKSVREFAARGDWCPDASCTPAQFKEQIGREAKLFLARTDGKGAAFLKPDFAFGPFRDYLGEKMPARDKLAILQRQWYDLSSLLTLLATNGVQQVVDAQVVERAGDPEEAKGKAKGKAKSKAKGKAKDGGEKQPSVETYRLTFLAAPSVLVQVVRDLSFRTRFTIVDGFAFTRERDAVFQALEADRKRDAAPKGGGRSRPRGRSKDKAEEPKEELAKGPVFDPSTDSVLKAELTVSVYDFRTLEDDEKEVSK